MEKKNPVSQEELDRMIEEKYRELERLEAAPSTDRRGIRSGSAAPPPDGRRL